jgi:hypothetical protein
MQVFWAEVLLSAISAFDSPQNVVILEFYRNHKKRPDIPKITIQVRNIE